MQLSLQTVAFLGGVGSILRRAGSIRGGTRAIGFCPDADPFELLGHRGVVGRQQALDPLRAKLPSLRRLVANPGRGVALICRSAT